MIVEGYCYKCNKEFDAHWHNVPTNEQSRFIMNPWCLTCKGYDVQIINDEKEDFESPSGDDEDYDD